MCGNAMLGKGSNESDAAGRIAALGAGKQAPGRGVGVQRHDGLLEQVADPAGAEQLPTR